MTPSCDDSVAVSPLRTFTTFCGVVCEVCCAVSGNTILMAMEMLPDVTVIWMSDGDKPRLEARAAMKAA